MEKIQGEVWIDSFNKNSFECYQDACFGYQLAQLKNMLYKYQGKIVEITIREIKK